MISLFVITDLPLSPFAQSHVLVRQHPDATVAVGTRITSSRADPYVQFSRIRLLPRVTTANACHMRASAVTRLPGSASGTCFAGSHSPWSPPFAPLAPLQLPPRGLLRRVLRFVRRLHSYYGEVRLPTP